MISTESFIVIDGDQVGKRLERVLLISDLPAATLLSREIADQFQMIQYKLENAGFIIHLSAGDMIIGTGPQEVTKKIIQCLHGSIVSVSIGTGNDLRDAYLALRYAKALGGGTAVEALRIIENEESGFLIFNEIENYNTSDNHCKQ